MEPESACRLTGSISACWLVESILKCMQIYRVYMLTYWDFETPIGQWRLGTSLSTWKLQVSIIAAWGLRNMKKIWDFRNLLLNEHVRLTGTDHLIMKTLDYRNLLLWDLQKLATCETWDLHKLATYEGLRLTETCFLSRLETYRNYKL